MIALTYQSSTLGVVPVLVGPLQVLLSILPGLLLGLLVAVVGFFRPSSLKHTAKLMWRQKVPLAVTVACIVGVVWTGKWIWAKLGPAAGAAEAASYDWPTVRGGLTRTGSAPGTKGPTRGALNWVWRTSGESFFSSPAVVGNRVYVASATLGAFSESGLMYCFDADTGALVWRNAPAGYRPTFSSPVISGNYLVCGEGLHVTRDSRIICLDISPGSDGKVLWTFRTNSHVECTPVIDKGRVYVGAGDDGYYCLELEGATGGRPKVVWQLPGKDYADAETSLAVHEGKVYAGLGLGGRALCVIDAESGKELNRLPMPYPVFSPAAIADGKLYLGMGNGDYVNTAEQFRANELNKLRAAGKSEAEIEAARKTLDPAGEVRCIDLATMMVEWTFKTPDTVLGAVAVAGDQLFFGCRDGVVYCLGRDGKLIGKWDSHAAIVTSPAVTDRHVYVINSAGMLYGLDRRSLECVWEFRVGAEPLFISSPAVARGRAYVGSQNDGLICAGEVGEKVEIPLWAGKLGGPGAAGHLDGSPLPEVGQFHWQYPGDLTGEDKKEYVQAPVAAVGSHILVPLAVGPKVGVACLPADADLSKTPAPRWVYTTANGVLLSPAAYADNAFIIDGKAGDAQRQLHCLDIGTGSLRWKDTIANDATGVFCAGEGQVFVQDKANALTSIDVGGGAQWSQTVGRLEFAPAVTGSMVVVAVSDPPLLIAMDRPTGRELWRVPLPALPAASPVVDKSTIYLGTAAGLEARSLIDGQILPNWQSSGGGVSGEFAVTRASIVYVNVTDELISISRDDGGVMFRVPGAIVGLSPIISRDSVLYAAKDGLMRIALDGENPKPEPWTDLSWLGKLTSPMVMKDSNIYVGLAGWGMVRLGGGK